MSQNVFESLPDEWQLSEGRHEGHRLIARFNTAARQLAGNASYSIQIGVAVPFLKSDADGMPSSDDMDQLTAFEEDLIRLAEGKAVFVGVLTTRGMREYILYTGSGEWMESFHEGLKAALPRHDVQVTAVTDPDWGLYREFVRE